VTDKLPATFVESSYRHCATIRYSGDVIKMLRRIAQGLIFLALIVGAFGQDSGSPPVSRTVAQVSADGWDEVGHKIVEMAQEFPEDKCNFKPAPDVRTFAEQLLHAATGTVYLAKIAHGEKAKYAELPREKYPRKVAIIAMHKPVVRRGHVAAEGAG